MLYLFPVSVAHAAGAGGGSSNPIVGMAPLILLFGVFYFLLIRPQQKKAKAHKAMLSRVEKGDNIITNGGLCGTVTNVGEETLTVEVASNVRVKVAKNAIANRKPNEG